VAAAPRLPTSSSTLPRVIATSTPPAGRVTSNTVAGSLSILASPMSSSVRSSIGRHLERRRLGDHRAAGRRAVQHPADQARRDHRDRRERAADGVTRRPKRLRAAGCVDRAGHHAALDPGQPLLIERLDG